MKLEKKQKKKTKLNFGNNQVNLFYEIKLINGARFARATDQSRIVAGALGQFALVHHQRQPQQRYELFKRNDQLGRSVAAIHGQSIDGRK